jgi:tetratricopeptide (TPR) repeat protein
MDYSDEYMRDYLLGKLPPEAAALLEQEIESDPELAESLELQRDIMIGIKAGFDDQLRQRLMGLDAGDTTKIKSITRQTLWQWASVAAILLGSLGVYLYINQTSLEERVFLAYFEDFPNIVEPAQRDEPGQIESFTAYQKGDYRAALDGFIQEEESNPEALYSTFYKGICALHLKDWNMAIESFEKARSSADTRFVEAATWYTGLAYLREGNRMRAGLILETLAESPGNFQTDAQAILAELE